MPDSPPFVVTIPGAEWDLASSERFSGYLEPTIDRPNVVIDMSGVQFIDSSCLGALTRMRRRREENGFKPARIVITASSIRRLFSIVQFDKLWKVFSTVDDALADAEWDEELEESS